MDFVRPATRTRMRVEATGLPACRRAASSSAGFAAAIARDARAASRQQSGTPSLSFHFETPSGAAARPFPIFPVAIIHAARLFSQRAA